MTHSTERQSIHIFINGRQHQISGDDAFLPLAQYLRLKADLPGTKVVCAEGDCGACTALVAKWNKNNWSAFQTLNSCIAPVYLFDLASVVTVEGLTFEDELNEVQTKMQQFHGGQCGYCTPGMVCALSGLAESCSKSGQQITEKKARNHLTGNLCRCTGYEPILNAAINVDLTKWISLAERYLTTSNKEVCLQLAADSIAIQGTNKELHVPTELAKALTLKKQSPGIRIVSGATDLGVLHNKGKFFLDKVLVLNRIPELSKLEMNAQTIEVGAGVSLTQFENFTENHHAELSRLLRVFASPQIKNQGTLAGNVLNGSPIGDSIPALLVLNAQLNLASTQGQRQVPLTSFYKAYKTFDLMPDEIATHISVPLLDKSWLTKYYKVSLRKDLDISAVTFAAAIKLKDGLITEARIALGGVGPTVVRMPEIEKMLTGQAMTEALFKTAGQKARALIKPLSDLRATDEYRLKVVENLFHKFFIEYRNENETAVSSSEEQAYVGR
ncbi:xanthine dehydrogenase small subunit [Bdellovibrio reynosensis]|uniref:FAD binding domain-containing protein n=1 Tax=Bdellovibrio reynosensis TaxID=2835041 RepID=A0ABY4C8K5_9BACT|nr:FAD binding domain-containing protein [Bdellovibrio reynosensis]UOF01257.1 FAD binding domain-containing protein [Bdellovibrio reynosensis]